MITIKRLHGLGRITHQHRLHRLSRITQIGVVGISLGLILFMSGVACRAEGETETVLLVKVKPNIIAMPGNSVEEVPIRYVRVRSTELRELFKEYGATAIAKYFEMRKIGNKPEERIEVLDTYLVKFSGLDGSQVATLLGKCKAIGQVASAIQK